MIQEKPLKQATYKNEAFFTMTSGLESLEALSLTDQEETAKAAKSIGADADNGTAVDTGIHTYLQGIVEFPFQGEYKTHTKTEIYVSKQ